MFEFNAVEVLEPSYEIREEAFDGKKEVKPIPKSRRSITAAITSPQGLKPSRQSWMIDPPPDPEITGQQHTEKTQEKFRKRNPQFQDKMTNSGNDKFRQIPEAESAVSRQNALSSYEFPQSSKDTTITVTSKDKRRIMHQSTKSSMDMNFSLAEFPSRSQRQETPEKELMFEKLVERSIELDKKYISSEGLSSSLDQLLFILGTDADDPAVTNREAQQSSSPPAEVSPTTQHLTTRGPEESQTSGYEQDVPHVLPQISGKPPQQEQPPGAAAQKGENVLFLAKPKMNTRDNRSRFASQLISYGPSRIIGRQLENQSFHSSFPIQMAHNYSVLAERFGTAFLSESGTLKGLETITTETPLRIDHDDEEEESVPALAFYRRAEPWAQWQETNADNRQRLWAGAKFTQLDLDLNHVEFDHHWLFSVGDSAARQLKTLYEESVELNEKLLKLVRKYMAMTGSGESERRRERSRDEKEGEEKSGDDGEGNMSRFDQEVLDTLLAKLQFYQVELAKVGALLERAWTEFQQIYGPSDTYPLTLNKVHGEQRSRQREVFEDVWSGEIPDELRTFFQAPFYFLNESESEQSEQQHSKDGIEIARLAAIQKCAYQAQIFFNGLLVCASEVIPLQRFTGKFSAQIARIYNLRVYERPEELRVCLRERFGRGSWQHLANIFLPLPEDETEDGANGSRRRHFEAVEFASEIVRGSYKGSLGCSQSVGSPHLQGRLFYTVNWTGNAGSGDVRQSERQCEERSATTTSLAPSLFHHETQLVAESELASELEFRALEHRYHRRGQASDFGETTADRNNQHPPRQSSADVLDNIRGSELAIDAHRMAGHRYAVLLRRHVLETAAVETRRANYSELVREEPVPTVFGEFGTVLIGRPELFPRKLKPTRRQVPATGTAAIRDPSKPIKLIVNIQAASNLPLRASAEASKVFVELLWQNQKFETNLVEGRHANWQETFALICQFPTPNGSSLQVPSALMTEVLELNVYDRVVSRLVADNRELDTTHEQAERRWLGTARVPFAVICALGKIDGHLPLKSPFLHTGYKMSEKHTTLKVLIGVDPLLLPPPPQPIAHSPGGETDSDNEIDDRCVRFEKRLRSQFPTRRFLALVNDSAGKRVLVSRHFFRFLREIQPPSQIGQVATENAHKTVARLSQIVASIPCINHPVMFAGGSDLWTTIDQMLKIGCGSAEEHGVLLVCWFMALQIPAVLVLGSALTPDGPNAAFVLVQFDDGTSALINPCDGSHYATTDTTCPLIAVGTIVTADNVYGNVQRTGLPSQLDFDLRNRAHWDSLFTEKRVNLGSVQAGTIVSVNDANTNQGLLVDMRSGLERETRLRFDAARFGIPQWNLIACKALRELLVGLASRDELLSPPSAEFDSLLSSQLGGEIFRVSAVIFHVSPYESTEQVVHDVLRTGMHRNCNRNVQFAIAVHVQPMIANHIVICTVALATLIPHGFSV